MRVRSGLTENLKLTTPNLNRISLFERTDRILKRLISQVLIGALFSLMLHRPAFAHAGVDHNNSCFLSVGETRLRLSGYQFQAELEGKHFCHFFPGLGQTVVALEPLTEDRKNTQVTLELAQLTSWLHPEQAFTVIKQQPAQLIGSGLVSISQTILQRGIYRLTITLQDSSGELRQQRFMFLVGIPMTKILVMIAGVLVLVIGFAGVKEFIKKA